MLRFAFTVLIGACCIVTGLFCDEKYWGLYVPLGAGFISAALIDILVFMREERQFLRIYFNIFTRPRKKIRLSLAYLLRIEVQGKYLLVKSNRIPNSYQPVGGVYKYYDSARHFLACIHALPDHSITQDDDSEDDLRLLLSARWRLRKFLKWFFGRQQREADPWREFYEELVATGIVLSSDFQYIRHELLGQFIEPIHFDKSFRVDTFKYVDIFSIHYVSDAQKNAIRQLLHTASDDFIWVTPEEIESEKTSSGVRILPHTQKILHPQKLTLC